MNQGGRQQRDCGGYLLVSHVFLQVCLGHTKHHSSCGSCAQKAGGEIPLAFNFPGAFLREITLNVCPFNSELSWIDERN